MISENCAPSVPSTSDRVSGGRGRLRTLSLFLIALGWLLGPHAISVMAQSVDPLEAFGIPPFSAQLPVEQGYVNTANGDLHLEIALGSYPERGGAQVKIALEYDSGFWNQSNGWNPWGPPTGYFGYSGGDVLNGWFAVVSSAPVGVNFNWQDFYICSKDGMPKYSNYNGWTWTDPYGTTHAFAIHTKQGWINNCGDWSNLTVPSGDAVAGDVSGYHMYVTNVTDAVVFGPDGTVYQPNHAFGVVEDANGNYMTSGAMDTLGKTLITRSANGNVVTYTVPNAMGGMSAYTVTKHSINVSTNFPGTPAVFQWNGALTVIQSIQLPDNTSYTFKYDCDSTLDSGVCGSPHGQSGYYGQVINMTLPTGAQIAYSYANFADSTYSANQHITRGISTRGTPDGTWSYTPAVIAACTSTYRFNCQQSLRVTKPSGDNIVYTHVIASGAYPTQVQYYNGSVSSANLLASTTGCYGFVTVTNGQCSYSLSTSSPPSGSTVLTAETTTVPIPGGTNLNRTTEYTWDANNFGNITQTKEWNFYTGTLPSSADRTTSTTYLGGPGTSYLSSTINITNRKASVTVTNASGATVSQTYDCYDYAGGCGGTSFVDAGNVANHYTSFGTSYTTRGNLTQVKRLISGTSNYLIKSMTYDTTGQVRTETDWSNGNTSTYSYADNFFTDGGDASNPTSYTPSTPTNAYLKTITHPTVNSVTLTETFGHYWGTGQKALSTDANSQTTYFHFYDSLDRPTSTKLPNTYNSSCCGWSYTVYPNGSETQVDTAVGITSTTRSITCTGTAGDCRHDQKQLDSLGRVTSQILVSDPDGQTSTVGSAYDSNGRVYSVSNPHRSTSLPTDGTEYYAYDGLNRIIQTTRADGSIGHTYYGAAVGSNGGLASQSCSGYGVGYPVLTVDEASKKRQSWTDGLGRLIEVDEPDPSSGSLSAGFATCYSYDLNNNLTGVTQGIQTRSFSYDMLSRLTSATNPESGTINYYYMTSGGSLCSGDPSAVCRRMDARSITTTYSYDAMNRVISMFYSDSTPSVTYGYDAVAASGCTPPSLTITNGKGHRTSMCDGAGATTWSYDAVGNILTEKRTTSSVTNAFTYTYNLDSSVATVSYPSGRSITYAPGGAQRSLSGKDTANSINYATGAAYAPQGALNSIQDGANLVSTVFYNSRLQPCRISIKSSGTAPTSCGDTSHSGNVMDLAYSFSTSDNGNVTGIANNIDGTRSQTFTYDSLNRIATAAASTYATSPSHCWGETFTLDRYGNLTGIGSISSSYNGCTQENLSITVSTSTNRISTSGFTYDSSGNLTSDGTVSPSYDAEGRITSVAGIAYYYDGDGQRVRKSSGAIYWYGVSPDPLLETDGSGTLTKEYIFFGGKRIASRDSVGSVSYYLADYLGSARVVTNASGTIQDDSDFYPYGGERAVSSGSGNRYKFEGKERDSESGLDDFGARYYASRYGRFMTPDWAAKATAVPYAVFGNPQTLNLYAFVHDNPESYADLDGHCDAYLGPGCADDSHGEPRDNPSYSYPQKAQNQNAAVQVVQDTVVGGAKEVANTVIDLSNAVTKPIDALLSNFTSFQFGQISEFQGSTTGEKSAMAGVFIASFFTGAGEEKAATKIGNITADAEKLYPKLAGKLQEHHIIPQYLGGAKDGTTARIPAAYHQLITNEFRALAPYGQKVKPTAEALGKILREVYSKYPLP